MEQKHIPLTEAHVQLLEKRGISGEIAQRLGWQTIAGRKGDWISMPYYRMGKVVNNKHRTISGEKQFSQDKGGEQCLYNLSAIEDIERLPVEDQREQILVITEGEMDCAIALQCGWLAVSCPNGAPSAAIESEDSIKFNYLQDVPKFCIVILAVDEDPAGMVLRQELALRLGWHRCKWVQYPKNKKNPERGSCKDLNEVFENYGPKGVNLVLKEKTTFMNAGGLFKLSELPESPELPTYECGIGNLSDMIKLRPGDMLIITGISSMGKSLLTNCIVGNMARNFGWNACLGSFEDHPRAALLRYYRTYYLQKPPVIHGLNNWTAAEISEADAWIEKHFSFIVPNVNDDELITLKWVLSRARAAITQHNARLVVIDPWNELDHDRPPGMSLTEYTGYAIKEFKRLAKQYMINVIIVAHPAKPEKSKDGSYGIPTLYDISDSAHWKNKCDIGVIVHRMEGEKPGDFATLVRVEKVRHWGVIGRIGDRFLQYLPERGDYIDYSDFQPKRRKPIDTAAKEKKDKKVQETASQHALPYAEN